MKNTITSAILIATLISMAPAAFAGEKNEKKKTETNTNVNAGIAVRYMGEDNDFVVLQVILTKGTKSDALLRISDASGNELFNERITSAEHFRYIKVSPDELKSIEVAYITSGGELRKKYNLNMTSLNTSKIEEVAIK